MLSEEYTTQCTLNCEGCRDSMVVGCLSPLIWWVYCKVYAIQHYVIKFVSDLPQVSGFLWVLQFPPPIKLTTTI